MAEKNSDCGCEDNECEGNCGEECECGHEHGESHALENLDEETQRSIQELQILEQNFQQLLMQKQAFRFELNETDVALDELKKAEGDVFRIVGNQIIIKTTKDLLEKEMNHKKELLDLRMKSMDKQEEEFSKKIESIRAEIIKKIQG
jgi:prefoldin beta subunit